MAGYASNNPFYMQEAQQPHVEQAYDYAEGFMQPGYARTGGGPGGGKWDEMFKRSIEPMMGENPGMGDEEWREAIRSISQSAQGERAQVGGLLESTGGGSVDPNALANLSSVIGAGVPQSVARLAASRAGLNRQARFNLGQLLQPLVQRGMQERSQYRSELMSGAGDILRGGTFTMPRIVGSISGGR